VAIPLLATLVGGPLAHRVEREPFKLLGRVRAPGGPRSSYSGGGGGRPLRCSTQVAVLNAATVIPGPTGLVGTVRATILPATPAGTYWLCFRHSAGATATGVVTFTVT
jgi:hypothetical protein